MKDMFKRDVSFGGSYQGEKTSFKFSNVGGAGLVVQNFTMTYSQEINRLNELGSPNTYFIAGRPNGTMTIAKVAGPTNIFKVWVDSYGDPCAVTTKGNALVVDMGGSWCAVGGTSSSVASGSSTALNGVLINQIGFTMNANDLMVAQNIQAMFISATIDEKADASVAV